MNVNPLTNPTAQAVDDVLIYIFGFSLILLLGITVVTIYFVIRYRRSKNPEPTSDVAHNFWLEAIWTILPTIIVLTMFWYGWVNYVGLREVPEGALEVKATARMWSWQIEYPDGRRDNKLTVPVGRPVKVILNSVDVLHSFFVPAFRIKRDMVPGMETYIWFTATEAGTYDVFCTEYCGLGHSSMITTIEALDETEYANWLQSAGTPATSGEPRGLTVINEQGCTGCHSLDGSEGIGPSLFQLSGQQRKIVVDGQTKEQVIDAEYLRRSIREPEAEMVEGYDPMMPPYDEETINEEDLQAVIDYLLGVAEAEPEKLNGRKLLEDNGCYGCHSSDGSRLVGPSFKGLAGRTIRIDRDGKIEETKADADYIRRSILQPEADIVEGFPAIMPSADYLSKEEIDAMVEELMNEAGD